MMKGEQNKEAILHGYKSNRNPLSIMGKDKKHEDIRKQIGQFKIICKNKQILNDQPFPTIEGQQPIKKFHELQCIKDYGVPCESQMFKFERSELGEEYVCIFNQQSNGIITARLSTNGKIFKALTKMIKEGVEPEENQVFQFVKTKYKNHYKILNKVHGLILCANTENRPAIFINNVEKDEFPDDLKAFQLVGRNDMAQQALNAMIESCIVSKQK